MNKAMKALITLSFLAGTIAASAQSTCALTLWAQPDEQGCVKEQFCGIGEVDLLGPELNGEVRSLAIADGYTVNIYQSEDLFGPHMLTLTGPQRIDDLTTLPMLSLRRNWDGAIGSFSIARTENVEPVVAPMVAGMR